MAGERSYAILTYPDLDEALTFFAALGFDATFHQRRPYPAAVVRREDLHIHLSGVAGFDPAGSLGSVIITVDNVDAWHESFRAGLARQYGRAPTAGIPRLLRPRRKAGTATGFTLVDVGGNWLRFYRAQAQPEQPATGLARVLEVAARQGDARGDDAQAVAVLTAGLERHPDAAPAERLEALAYRAELRQRLGLTAEAAADAAAAESLAREHALEASSAPTLEHLRRLLGG